MADMWKAKTLLILLALVWIITPCTAGPWAFSGLSGADNSVALSAGKIFNEGKGEAGLALLGTGDGTQEDYELALGGYGAVEFEVPGLRDLLGPDEAKTFAGGGLLWSTEENRLLGYPLVGIMLLPDRSVSPVGVWRFNVMDGGIESAAFDEGSVWLFGLHIRTN